MLLAVCGALARTTSAAEPTLVSVKHDTHTFRPADSYSPSLSADGRTITFESQARLTPDDRNRVRDLYVFNPRTNDLRRVPPPTPVRLNTGASVGRSGRWVVFNSYNMAIPSNRPRTADVYLYKVTGGAIAPLFSDVHDQLRGGEAAVPVLSRDDAQVLFTSNSESGVRQIYLADRKHESLELISKAGNGDPGNRTSGLARLSADASVVVFLSAATNFDTALPATSLSTHLYRAVPAEDVIVRIDTFEHGYDDNEWMTGSFDIDDDANIVVFEARHRSSNDPFATLAASDLFVYDEQTKKITLATEGLFAGVSRNPSLSGDGRYVAFVLTAKKQQGVVVLDRAQKAWKQAAVGAIDDPVLSKNGCVIAFERQDKNVRNVYTVSNPFLENDHACD
jgi:hypothetical protein